MTETTPRARRVRIGVFLALAIGGIALACEAPAPDAPLALEPQATRAAEEAASTEVDRTPPALLDDAAVHEAIRAGYPPLLRDAGIEGTAEVQLYVNASGQVERMQLNATSGYEALDAAALKVAGQLRFRPATEGGSAVAAWTKVPIGFELEGAAAAAKAGVEEDVKTVEEAIAQLTGEPARPERGVFERERTADGPQFTPFNQAPALRNRNEVQRLLQHEYPPLLRDAGIGGGADVWLYIEADGTLTKSQLNRTSGYPALDEAALRVAQQMQFEPARKGDQPVPVWVSLKIEFTAK